MQNDFQATFYQDAQIFLSQIYEDILNAKLFLDWSALDHICFRVSHQDEYNHAKLKLIEFGELLVESMVGGRLIASFKLAKPIEFKGAKIYIVELPAPKASNKYVAGFEHAEFVIKDNFQDFMAKYPDLKFSQDAINKKINPDIRLKFASGLSVKFHHQGLEQVIEYEKSIS